MGRRKASKRRRREAARPDGIGARNRPRKKRLPRTIPAKGAVRAWEKLVQPVGRQTDGGLWTAGRPARGVKGRHSDKAAVRKLADDVFAQRDPVAVAMNLLDSDKHTVAARVWERLLEYRFGKPAQMIETSGRGGGPLVVKIISHVPRPDRAATLEATPLGSAQGGELVKP
jgi:hypothetical protein